MPYAIELELDEAGGAVVRRLWHGLSSVGATWMQESGATPHVSLAIWERVDVAALEAEVRRFAGEIGPIPIAFDGIGTFASGAVYLKPTPDPALVALQRRCHARFSPFAAEPWNYYLPECWVPHCTLAQDVPLERMAEAVAVAERATLPVVGRPEAVSIVEFRPVRLLARHPLGG